MPIQRSDFFATPESTEALLGWVNLHSGSEKAVAMTAAMMGWNLACKFIEDDDAIASSFNAEFLKNRQEAFDRYENEAREHG